MKIDNDIVTHYDLYKSIPTISRNEEVLTGPTGYTGYTGPTGPTGIIKIDRSEPVHVNISPLNTVIGTFNSRIITMYSLDGGVISGILRMSSSSNVSIIMENYIEFALILPTFPRANIDHEMCVGIYYV